MHGVQRFACTHKIKCMYYRQPFYILGRQLCSCSHFCNNYSKTPPFATQCSRILLRIRVYSRLWYTEKRVNSLIPRLRSESHWLDASVFIRHFFPYEDQSFQSKCQHGFPILKLVSENSLLCLCRSQLRSNHFRPWQMHVLIGIPSSVRAEASYIWYSTWHMTLIL